MLESFAVHQRMALIFTDIPTGSGYNHALCRKYIWYTGKDSNIAWLSLI